MTVIPRLKLSGDFVADPPDTPLHELVLAAIQQCMCTPPLKVWYCMIRFYSPCGSTCFCLTMKTVRVAEGRYVFGEKETEKAAFVRYGLLAFTLRNDQGASKSRYGSNRGWLGYTRDFPGED